VATRASKPKAHEYAVSVRRTEQGDYELGATIDGAFVVFVTRAKAYAEAKIATAIAAGEPEPEPESEES